jgi:hypothetical protein
MTMGRPRTKRKDLPPGLRWRERGGYYYVGTRANKRDFVPIGPVTREAAIKAWVKITQSQPEKGEPGTLGEIIDGYLRFGLPMVKAETTRTEYERQASKLRERWGERRYAKTEAQAVTGDYLKPLDFTL